MTDAVGRQGIDDFRLVVVEGGNLPDLPASKVVGPGDISDHDIFHEIGSGKYFKDETLGVLIFRRENSGSNFIRGKVTAGNLESNSFEKPADEAGEFKRGFVRHKRERLTRPGLDGEGVTAALIDDGVDLNHPFIRPALIASLDPFRPMLGIGGEHGTKCAGVIVGRATDQSCPYGIAPAATLLVAQYRLDMPRPSVKSRISTIDFILSLSWAVSCGAKIISFSYGQIPERIDPNVQLALKEIASKLRRDNVCLVFCSAGNRPRGSNQRTCLPAGTPGFISVGGYAWSDDRGIVASEYTNSIDADDRDEVFLGPSSGIPTAVAGGGGEITCGFFRGSSAACAYVSGQAILWYQYIWRSGGSEPKLEAVLKAMRLNCEYAQDPNGRGRKWMVPRFPP